MYLLHIPFDVVYNLNYFNTAICQIKILPPSIIVVANTIQLRARFSLPTKENNE
jgi:hypothetical protein